MASGQLGLLPNPATSLNMLYEMSPAGDINAIRRGNTYSREALRDGIVNIPEGEYKGTIGGMPRLSEPATNALLEYGSAIPGIGDAGRLGGSLATIAGATDKSLIAETKRLMREKQLSKRQAMAETGQYEDIAGNWKQVISDADAELSPSMLDTYKKIGNNRSPSNYMPLGSVLKHNKLYDLFPEFTKKINVQYDRRISGLGSFEAKWDADSRVLYGGTIRINPAEVRREARRRGKPESEVLMDVMIHEIGHTVQAEQYLPYGSSTSMFSQAKSDISKKSIENTIKQAKARYKIQLKTNPEGAAKTKRSIDNATEHLRFINRFEKTDDYILYRQTLGEADAEWSSVMRRDPSTEYTLPLHEDPTQGKQLWEDFELDFDPDSSAITRVGDPFTQNIAESKSYKSSSKAKYKANKRIMKQELQWYPKDSTMYKKRKAEYDRLYESK